jgi:hypothetical protein
MNKLLFTLCWLFLSYPTIRLGMYLINKYSIYFIPYVVLPILYWVTYLMQFLRWLVLQIIKLMVGWINYLISGKRLKHSIVPKLTKRNNLHRVSSNKTSWCLSIRGPWAKTWVEYNEETNTVIRLTNGRIIITDKWGL